MSRNIVFEGWLTKSPPTKRIWRTKWRRRWFALRQGDLPGQYFLDYYADRNCRRHKGTINLDLCEQVDAGLHMERTRSVIDPKLRGSVFTIQTQSRVYHLEADCEGDMEKWVDAICRVCGLRATEDTAHASEPYTISAESMTAKSGQHGSSKSTGPYIPISECITGVRHQQEGRRSFSCGPKNAAKSSRTLERVSDGRSHKMYLSQPQIRSRNTDFSETESIASEDERNSLNASQYNILPPEVPPRPPKTLPGYKLLQHYEQLDNPTYGGRVAAAQRTSRHAPPARLDVYNAMRSDEGEDEACAVLPSAQYLNLPSLPPAVDRALKPRRSSHSLGPKPFKRQSPEANHYDEVKAVALQYLDLDLQVSIPATSKPREFARNKVEIIHGKSASVADADSAYKTVDFLKTEAFNITRQDAEASRSNPN